MGREGEETAKILDSVNKLLEKGKGKNFLEGALREYRQWSSIFRKWKHFG
jgi:hypothetical protein